MAEPPDRTPALADPWFRLRRATPARIALGRAGLSLPTRAMLDLAMAHAGARDAVHAALDVATLERGLQALGFGTIAVHSAAPDRATYLARPDYGRRLDDASRARLAARSGPETDIAIVVADGLSASAGMKTALPVLAALAPAFDRHGWRLTPVAVAQQGRVALGDEIGEAFRASMVMVMIGERPGLSSPDSLGFYLTWAPRPGRLDSERNCISNVRDGGLTPEQAASRLEWLLAAAFARRLTGVSLKDESGSTPLGSRRSLPGGA